MPYAKLFNIPSFILRDRINVSRIAEKNGVPLSFQAAAFAVKRKYSMFTPCLNEEYIVVEDVTARDCDKAASCLLAFLIFPTPPSIFRKYILCYMPNAIGSLRLIYSLFFPFYFHPAPRSLHPNHYAIATHDERIREIFVCTFRRSWISRQRDDLTSVSRIANSFFHKSLFFIFLC